MAVGLGRESGSTPKEKNNKTPVFPWGSQWPPPRGAGNYADSAAKAKFSGWSASMTFSDGYATTAPRLVPANGFGLFDLGGNVWEWCEDWYDPSARKYRVLRGGCWGGHGEVDLRSSGRSLGIPGGRGVNVGFRCVLSFGS